MQDTGRAGAVTLPPTQFSVRLLEPARAVQKHGHSSCPDDLVGNAAEHERAYAAARVRRHRYQVGAQIMSYPSNALRWRATDDGFR